MTIGYARLSTDGQTLDNQQAALTAPGAKRVYSEKVAARSRIERLWQRQFSPSALGDVFAGYSPRSAWRAPRGTCSMSLMPLARPAPVAGR
jgi:Resolvase, N terminal domain